MGGTEPLLLGCAGSSIEWRTKNGNGPGYGIRIVDVLLAYRLKPGGPGSGDAGEGGAESQSRARLLAGTGRRGVAPSPGVMWLCLDFSWPRAYYLQTSYINSCSPTQSKARERRITAVSWACAAVAPLYNRCRLTSVLIRSLPSLLAKGAVPSTWPACKPWSRSV